MPSGVPAKVSLPQCEFLAVILERMIKETISQEFHLLQKFDEARTAIGEIVDMPDRKRESLLERVHSKQVKLAEIVCVF